MTDITLIQAAEEVVKDVLADKSPKPAYRRAKGVPEFFGFDNRNHVFSLGEGTMDPIQRKLGWIEEPCREPVEPINGSYPVAFSLPLGVEGLRSKYYPLNMGLVVISGSTKAGKSSFLRALASTVDIKRLLAVEPYDTPEDIEELPYYSSADSALAAAVKAHYKGDVRSLYAIDSLRAPLFETSGNAGTKGIVMPFLTQITRVSQELAKAGMTILATINPMEDDAAFTDSFLKKLSASVSTCILLTSSEVTSGGARFTGTVASRPDRTPRQFTFSVGSDTKRIPQSDLLSELSFIPADNGFTDIQGDLDLVHSLEKVI